VGKINALDLSVDQDEVKAESLIQAPEKSAKRFRCKQSTNDAKVAQGFEIESPGQVVEVVIEGARLPAKFAEAGPIGEVEFAEVVDVRSSLASAVDRYVPRGPRT